MVSKYNFKFISSRKSSKFFKPVPPTTPLSKVRVSLGPEAGLGDRKVVWEGRRKLKNQASGGHSTFPRTATSYYALEERRK